MANALRVGDHLLERLGARTSSVDGGGAMTHDSAVGARFGLLARAVGVALLLARGRARAAVASGR